MKARQGPSGSSRQKRSGLARHVDERTARRAHVGRRRPRCFRTVDRAVQRHQLGDHGRHEIGEGAVVGAALGSSDGELGSSGRLVGSTIDDGVGDDSGVGGAGGSGTDSVGVGVDVGVGVGVEGCVGGVGGRSFTRLVIVKPRT